MKRREPDPSGSDAKANAPFTVVYRTDEANFTDVAIEVLRHDNRANPAFQYAAAHGTSSTDYDALTELPRLDASYGREIYLSQMRRKVSGVRNYTRV